MQQKLLLSAICLLLFVLPSQATKRRFTLEDLYRLRTIEDVHLSPNGRFVAFTLITSDLARAKRTKHIWMMDTDGRNARQFTYSEKDESSAVFSADGKWIAFISSRDGDGNLYIMPTTGGEAHQLTHISPGVSDPLWSPDGKWIAFSSDVYPECGADDACNKKIAQRWSKGPLQAHMADGLLYRHWTEWRDGKRTHILLADVSTGAVRDLTPGDFDSPPFQVGGSLQYDFAPDSTELVFASNRDSSPASSTNSDLWTVALSGVEPTARDITASNPAFDGNPRYSPDGKYIAYRLQKQPGYESDLFRLAIYNRSTGRSQVLTESFRNWVQDFQWAPNSKSLYFTAPLEGDNPVFQVILESGRIGQVLEDKTIDSFAIFSDNRRMIYTRRSVGEPAEFFAVDLRDGKASSPLQLSHFNDQVADEVDIRPTERMWVTGAAGARIEVFIVKPHDFDPAKKYPLILNSRRAAAAVAGFIPRRLAGISRRRVCRRLRQSARLHRLRAGLHGPNLGRLPWRTRPGSIRLAGRRTAVI